MKDETKRSAGADGADGADEKEKSDGRDGGIGRDGGTDGGELLSARARVIAATEGETATEETEAPRRRLRDFLYRHRALFIICTAAVLLVLLSLKIFFSGGALADVSMIYAGPVPLYSDTGGAIVSAIRSVHNGEDAEEIYLADVLWYSPEDEEALGDAYSVDAAENARALMEFREEMTSGERVLMLLSPQLYREVGEGLLPLSEVFVLDAARISADGYSVRLGDTDFYSYFTAAKVLPEDTLICMRDVSKMKIYGEGQGRGGGRKMPQRVPGHREFRRSDADRRHVGRRHGGLSADAKMRDAASGGRGAPMLGRTLPGISPDRWARVIWEKLRRV